MRYSSVMLLAGVLACALLATGYARPLGGAASAASELSSRAFGGESGAMSMPSRTGSSSTLLSNNLAGMTSPKQEASPMAALRKRLERLAEGSATTDDAVPGE